MPFFMIVLLVKWPMPLPLFMFSSSEQWTPVLWTLSRLREPVIRTAQHDSTLYIIYNVESYHLIYLSMSIPSVHNTNTQGSELLNMSLLMSLYFTL